MKQANENKRNRLTDIEKTGGYQWGKQRRKGKNSTGD